MLWLTAFIPVLSGLLLLVWRPQHRFALASTAALSLLGGAAALWAAAVDGSGSTWRWGDTLLLHAALTPLSLLVAATVLGIALPVGVYAALRESRAGLARLVGLLLIFTGAMQWLVLADDLLTLLIGWELVGACSWALIAHEWREPEHPSAAQFAFIATRLGDIGLFVAAIAAWSGAGSFAYADLARLDPTHLGLVAGGLSVAAISKSGQLPFSPWLFRAMAGPTAASALLHAATMVAAGAYLLARLQPVLSAVPWFGPLLMAVGLLTALAGGLVALLQPQVKKLLAASTSAHFGLMFIAIGAGFPGVALLHLVAHGGFKALLFLCAGVAIDHSGSHELSRMQIGRALPWVAVLAAIGSVALAGLPPLGAGWTKEAIVAAAASVGNGWAAATMVAGALSAAYAVRWCWLAYGWGDASTGAAASDADSDSNEAAASAARTDATRLSRPALATLVWLAAICIGVSLLWLPAVREVLAATLAVRLPAESVALGGTAVLLLLIGGLVGRWLAQQQPQLGHAGLSAALADWLGLPGLIDLAVTKPMQAAARTAATIDDRFIDALPRGVARAARWVSGTAGQADDRWVDRGVRLATAFVQALARINSRFGEAVADGFVVLPSRLVEIGAGDARRLQTGLSHHAFAVLLIGSLLLGALLFAAAP